MMKDWTSCIIDDLCAAKGRGEDFESAWRAARLRHKPRGRDRDEPATNLFEAARGEESLSEFLRRVAFDAWHGFNPQVRGIALLTEADVFPRADVVRVERPGRSRQAAA